MGKMIKRPGEQSVGQRDPVKQGGQPPGDGGEGELQEADVVEEKSRAYVVAEAQEIITFLRRYVFFPNQVGDDLGAHGKAAQKAQEHGVAAFLRDPEDPSEHGGIEGSQIPEHAGGHQQVGQDHKGQQGGQDCRIPQSQPQRASGCGGTRVGEEQKKQAGYQENTKYLFQEATI